jgi:hypothetical protein
MIVAGVLFSLSDRANRMSLSEKKNVFSEVKSPDNVPWVIIYIHNNAP